MNDRGKIVPREPMTNVVPIGVDVHRTLPWQLGSELEQPQPTGPEDQRLWSVTTIIDQIGGSGGLVDWAARETAAWAIADLDHWVQMVASGNGPDAVDNLARRRFRPRPPHLLTAKAAGSLFHGLAERWIYDQRRPPCDDPEVNMMLDMFGKWLDHFQPSFEALEMTVYHPDQRYAGTLDAIINHNGSLYVLDYKTTLDDDEPRRKRPWHSVALQLAAYRHATNYAVWRARVAEVYSRRYYLLSPDERANALPMPEIAGAFVLHVSPYHADLYYVRTDRDVFVNGFLAAVNAAEWTLRLADTAIDFDTATLINRQ